MTEVEDWRHARRAILLELSCRIAFSHFRLTWSKESLWDWISYHGFEMNGTQQGLKSGLTQCLLSSKKVSWNSSKTWSDGKIKPYFFGTYKSSIIIQCYTLAQTIITTLSKDTNFLELSQTTASALQISVHIPSLGYLIKYWKGSLECEF